MATISPETTTAIHSDLKPSDLKPSCLKLLTINLCLHLPGARNKYNVSLIANSIKTLILALLVSCVLVPQTWWLVWWIPAGLVLVIVTCQFFAMWWSLLLHFVLGKNYTEYKKERVHAFWEIVDKGAYDIIACQEMYGSWFWGSNSNKNRMLRNAKKRGYHFVKTGKPKLPAMLFDQGLCIFSKYPITDHAEKIYDAQTIWDKYFVNRAALYAEITVDKNKPKIRVLTTHTSPSLKDMKERTKMAKILSEEGESTVSKQAGEMNILLLDKAKKSKEDTAITVVMGDFNCEGGDDDYKYFERNFSASGLRDITRNEDGTWTPTFAQVDEKGEPLETLLTVPGLLRKPQSLDFVFTDAEVIEGPIINRLVVEGKAVERGSDRTKIQQVSDHSGVEFSLSY